MPIYYLAGSKLRLSFHETSAASSEINIDDHLMTDSVGLTYLVQYCIFVLVSSHINVDLLYSIQYCVYITDLQCRKSPFSIIMITIYDKDPTAGTE